jgi:hypothetical protein
MVEAQARGPFCDIHVERRPGKKSGDKERHLSCQHGEFSFYRVRLISAALAGPPAFVLRSSGCLRLQGARR